MHLAGSMMSTNSFSSSSPGFPARQQNSQYSPYVSPSLRQQGQRFNYAPSPYPRPRSSASKPNPALSGETISYPIDDFSPANEYYYRSEQPYSNNYGSNASDKNGRIGSSYGSGDYGSPSSEYYSCNEDSFRSPMNSMSPHGNYQSSGYPGTKSQYSPFSSGFGGSPNKQPPGFQGSGYGGSPLGQQKRRGFGQRRFTQGRNGVPTAQKRGATSGFLYQGSGSGVDGSAFQNTPTKKPRVSVRCEICNIDFTSDIPYKMHLAGAKHMKKVKSKEVLETMETQGQVPQAKDNYYYCEHCQVMANSSQQLQMHLDGTKHKNKVRKLNEGDNKTEDTPKNDEVTEDTEPKPAKMSKFYCDVCSLSLNSEIQLTQHLASKKHDAKVKGEPFPVKKKARKFTDAPANGNEISDGAAPSTETTNDTEKSEDATTAEPAATTTTTTTTQQKTYAVQELGSSFVPGGVLQ